MTSVSAERTLSLVSDSVTGPLPALRSDRPAVLISSTSWTPDEDFGMLIEALKGYEMRARTVNIKSTEASQRLPKVVMIVTGKGPLRERYMSTMLQLEEEERWEWVRCRSMWLEAADYPLLLGMYQIQQPASGQQLTLDDRSGGCRYQPALQLFSLGPSHESGRYVRLWPSGVCTRLRMVRVCA